MIVKCSLGAVTQATYPRTMPALLRQRSRSSSIPFSGAAITMPCSIRIRSSTDDNGIRVPVDEFFRACGNTETGLRSIKRSEAVPDLIGEDLLLEPPPNVKGGGLAKKTLVGLWKVILGR